MALSRRATLLIGLVWMLAVFIVVGGVLIVVFGLSWFLSLSAWFGAWLQ